MEAEQGQPATIDAYIAQFPQEVQQILLKIRAVIREAAPGAVERISYRMPAFYLNGPLVWFAAYRQHVGFYPKPSGIEAFQERLAGYKCSKGAIQFPLDQPMPYALIGEIVRFRVAENTGSSGGDVRSPAKRHVP